MKSAYVFIGRCPVKGCGCILQLTIPAKLTNHTRNVNYVPGGNLPPIYESFQRSEPAWKPGDLWIHCARHRTSVGWREIDGRLNPDHICDARCTGAKGHSCDCSCGGANHGRDYAIAV